MTVAGAGRGSASEPGCGENATVRGELGDAGDDQDIDRWASRASAKRSHAEPPDLLIEDGWAVSAPTRLAMSASSTASSSTRPAVSSALAPWISARRVARCH